ncbi:PREDICTED: gamma-aminobutyric acid receptor subunit theta [Miniopterus natalensis]|uniref:gamma-aminobutyric acid receptor subunit theta n=1 Tax=Miniopterus natalensis TaxID=291302 RepID=UPI0007A6E8EF|nr:PREDICTED: gamma-aminobutyric acid receptor subunit theta [Miniopterus natalensis]
MGIRGMLRAAVLLLLIRTWLSEGNNATPLPEFHLELSSTVPEVVQNVFNCKNCASEAVVHKILDRVLSGYDAHLRPHFGGEPVPVGISMYVSSIEHISEITMDCTVTMFFHQTWKDPCLAYCETHLNLTLDYRMVEKLWVPDFYFLNSKDGFVHDMTVKNLMFQLHPDGTVQDGIQLITTAACSMNLQKYPMDKQTCKLEVESYGYTVEDNILYWEGDKNAIQGTEKLHIPQFTLLGKIMTNKEEIFYTGSYVRLILRFLIQRKIINYLVQIYWPTILTTIASWITFWMNYESSVTRVTVGLTEMLILNALNSHLRENLPEFSCIKAIDIYTVVCFFFVFLSLLEYVYVNYLFYSRVGTHYHYRQRGRAQRIVGHYHYQESRLQPQAYQRTQEEEILSVKEINNHFTSADEEGPLPAPFPKVLIHVGFESTDFISLSAVSSKDNQVNIKNESGSPPFRPVQAHSSIPESLNSLTFISEQVPLATSESLSSLSSLSVQSWLATGESLSDLSSTSEQALHSYDIHFNGFEIDGSVIPTKIHNHGEAHGHAEIHDPEDPEESYSLDNNHGHGPNRKCLLIRGQKCVQEESCRPDIIHIRCEVFLSLPGDIKVDRGYLDLKKQLQHDSHTIWSHNGDSFMGFDQDEDSNSESDDSCPPNPGYSFRERFCYELFDPDYVPKVDKWSRILFPLAFVVFNIIYWPYNGF